MLVDNKTQYTYGLYTYTNFTALDDEQLLRVLEWRNHPDIKKCMNNTNTISKEEHLNFCHNLKNRNDLFYWIISKDDEPIAVLNIININYEQLTCEPGFYMVPELMGMGGAIFVLYNYKSFLLNKLGFKGLIGHNYLDNISALSLTLFFGAKVLKIVEINKRKCVLSFLTREAINELGEEKLVLKYNKFYRDWSIEEFNSTYENR